MTRPAAALGLALFACFALSACDDEPATQPPPDAAADAAMDASPDAAQDAAPADAGPDAQPDATPDLGVDAGPLPQWGYLQDVRSALRGSPDHLPARADALIAQADPEALFRFVRDEIAVVPTEAHRWVPLFNQDRLTVGPRGALRAGEGTARDKVELLAHLLRRAGLEAEVWYGTWAPADHAEAVALWITRRPQPVFQPAQSADALAARREAEGMGAGAERPMHLPTAATDAFAERVLADVPMGGEPFDTEPLSGLPLVRVVVDGEVTWAQPLHPDAEFGDPLGDPAEFDGPYGAEPGKPVVVELATWSADGERTVEARAEWPMDEVVGRAVLVGLVPALSAQQLLQTDPAGVQAFVPTVSLTAGDALPEGLEPGAAGDALNLQGDRLTLTDEGALQANGFPLPTGAPGGVERVVQLQAVEADVSAWPLVRVFLRPEDAEGAAVQGLGASAFALTDEGDPTGFTLARNTTAPRVQYLYDISDSMPFELWSATDATIAAARAALAEARPEAALAPVPTESDLWAALNKGLVRSASQTIYLTDGEASDQPPAEFVPALAGQAPPVFLSAVDPPSETLLDMAARTGGAVRITETPMAVAQAVGEAVAQAPEGRYALTLLGQGSPGTARTVTVQTPTGVMAQVQYTPPGEAAAATPLVTGLELFVRVDGREVSRALAGHAGPPPAGVDLAALNRDVWASARDRATLLFERGAPLNAVALADLVDAQLSTRAAFEVGPTPDEAVGVLEAGLDASPSETLGIFPRFETQPGAVVFAAGLRAALVRSVLRADADGQPSLARRLDYLPLAQLAAAGPVAGPERFATTLRASLVQAAIEGAAYQRSTLDLLGDAELAYVDAVGLPPFDEAADAAWRFLVNETWFGFHRYVDAAGSTEALWAVDPATGEAHALLRDGSGGGQYAEFQEFAEIERALDATNLGGLALSAMNKAFNLGGGGVIFYGKFLANAYGAVAIVVGSITGVLQDEDGQQAIALAACRATKHIASLPFGIPPDPNRIWARRTLADLWDVPCDGK